MYVYGLGVPGSKMAVGVEWDSEHSRGLVGTPIRLLVAEGIDECSSTA